ncbi:MAG: helix-hairpin-helix domain-containing protein [bacterium]
MWRDVFGFNRAETFALVVLLLLFCVGGGIYLYQKTSETIPAELIFEPVELASATKSRPAASGAAITAPLRSRQLRININTAPAESLELLPAIGPVISGRIIDYRTACGGFDSVGQLIEVKGIGARRLADLRPYVAVD